METILYVVLLSLLGTAGYFTIGGVSGIQSVRRMNENREVHPITSFLLAPRAHYHDRGYINMNDIGPWEGMVIAAVFGWNFFAWPLKYLINLPQYFVYGPALVSKNRRLALQAGHDPNWPQLPAGERMRRLLAKKDELAQLNAAIDEEIDAEQLSSDQAAAELEAARIVNPELPAPKEEPPPQLTE